MTLAVPDALQYLLGPGATWRDVGGAVLDLAVVGYLVYRVLLLIRGTRAIQVLVGLFLLGVGYVFSQWANLLTVNWLLGEFLTYSFIFGVIVLFQADIRRGLARLGRGSLLLGLTTDERHEQASVIEAVTRAACELSRRRRGALIVIERQADLGEVIETGVKLDALLSEELLLALFVPNAALHDGAVVLQRGRIAAGRCLLPLTSSTALRDVGTRHRAALGLAEEVDAVVVVVSEERGELSVAVDGVLQRRLDEGALRDLLARLLVLPGPRRGFTALLPRWARAPTPPPLGHPPAAPEGTAGSGTGEDGRAAF